MSPPQHPVTLEYRDAALEAAYRLDTTRRTRRPYRVVSLVIAAIWASAVWIDLDSGTANARVMMAIRFGATMPVLLATAGFVWFASTDTYERRWPPVAASALVSVLFGLVADAWLMPAPARFNAFQGLLGFGLSVVAGYTLITVRFAVATVFSALASSLFCAAVIARWHGMAATALYWSVATLGTGMLIGAFLEQFRRRAFWLARQVDEERARSDRLLRNVLPASIAERLKDDHRIAEQFDDATVLFADLAGFTPLAQRLSPPALVDALDEVFSAFDDIAERHGLEKIKTIGDAYMLVGGVPNPRVDHAIAVAEMALEMRDLLATRRFAGGEQLALRIGIHSGPVVAGVIGKRKFSYDVWGDTVNTASRMESHGLEGGIQVSEATYHHLRERFELEARGVVQVKGKGAMPTWMLLGRR